MHIDVVREGVAGGMVDATEEVIRQGHLPTLRDRFAMAALQGLLAGGMGHAASLNAYRIADEMLLARARPIDAQFAEVEP